MRFTTLHLLLFVAWVAMVYAGWALSGLGAGILVSLFCGFALLCGSQTIATWPLSREHERRVGLFATIVSVTGLVFIFLTLLAKQLT